MEKRAQVYRYQGVIPRHERSDSRVNANLPLRSNYMVLARHKPQALLPLRGTLGTRQGGVLGAEGRGNIVHAKRQMAEQGLSRRDDECQEKHILTGHGEICFRELYRRIPPPRACIRYYVDLEKLNTEGVLEPVTESEEYRMPEGIEPRNTYAMPTDNQESVKRRKNHVAKNKPTKEQLFEDLKTMTLNQIAKKYGASGPSTVSFWVKQYGLQKRDRIATALEQEPDKELVVVTKEPVTVAEPTQESESDKTDTVVSTPNVTEHKSAENPEEIEQALNLISAVSASANRRIFVRVQQFLAESIEQAQRDGQEANTSTGKLLWLVRVEVLKDMEADLIRIVGGDNAGA
ncbi:MAG: hypothetical protein ACYCVD_02940 [Desulfitobacteriaceae bacterium]